MRRLPKLLIIIISLIVLTVIVKGVIFYQAKAIPNMPMLDVTFEHSNHRKQTCAGCHHNFTDGASGPGGCFNCHKYNNEINRDIEKTFHEFCTDCHIKNAKRGNNSGPKRRCNQCHKDDRIVD